MADPLPGSVSSSGSAASRMGRPGAAAIEQAAARIFRFGWLKDDSAVTPGVPVWTARHADELYEHFVDRSDASGDDFMSKFENQLAPASDEAKQLAVEIFYLNLLPLADYYGVTKRQLLQRVLSWMTRRVTIPEELDRALDAGVFNGGVAFKTRRWQQLALLIQTVREWKKLVPEERVRRLEDPWAFRDFVQAVPGTREPAQRNALLYLAHPDVFLPIVNTDHRKRIRQAFLEYAPSPSGDLDRDLCDIYRAMERENGGPVDFYQPPWRERWLPSQASEEFVEPPTATETRRAWLVRGSNVQGRNLVPVWLERGSCSLPAAQLRPVEGGLSRDQIAAIVETDYAHVSYNARSEKVREFHAFLSRMQVGDLVATTSEGRLFVGVVTGEPTYLASSDGRSNLRRSVDWRPGGIDYSELPAPLPARLQTQHDVLDLTQELSLLETLLGQVPPPPRTFQLPDADDALAERLLVPRSWLQECVELLRDRPQLIFYGPPGTGKTYLAQRIAWHLAGPDNTKLVQFHPAYSYEDFFEGYRPGPGEGGAVGFRLTPGPLRRLVDQAREHPEQPFALIIDEINRGNLAKIFGELYFLLEYRDQAIDLLYSSGDEQGFTLPRNVLIIGTMNTADRSIALVDAAMRRRFAFLPLHPSEPPTRGMLRRWLERTGRPDSAARLLDELNRRIDDTDFKIGPSYLMREAAYDGGGFDRVWRTAVLPLLEEHHFGEGVDVVKRYGLASLRAAVEAQGEDQPDDAAG